MPTAANIVVGAPTTIKFGEYNAAEGACTDLGATEGGATLSFKKEFYLHKADQWQGPVGATPVSEDCTLSFDLAEASLINFAVAMGYDPDDAISTTTLSFGGKDDTEYCVLYVNGYAVSGGTVKITLYKCIVEADMSAKWVKDDKVLIPVKVHVLQDTSKTADQQYGTIVYTSTDTTPPTVAMTSPVEDGTVVAGASTTLTLTFTEAANAIDEGTLIANETVVVALVTDGTATAEKAITISYNAGTKVLTVTPVTVWPGAGAEFEIRISKTVRDTAGNKMAANFYGHFVTA